MKLLFIGNANLTSMSVVRFTGRRLQLANVAVCKSHNWFNDSFTIIMVSVLFFFLLYSEQTPPIGIVT